MVSHELRTPLTAIKEGINIVIDGSVGNINNDQKDFLGTAKRNVDRLARLVNDVLDFQKLESGKMRFDFKENDINKVIEEVRDTMNPVIQEKGLGFNIKLAKNLSKVNFDKDKIVQVLTNLVNNAVKFTEKGSVIITTSEGNNIIQISVQDTGSGIKNEDMPKLFQSFQQLETPKERKVGGTGLGLVICKEIVERHKGKIWAESEFGKGTTFHFVIPIKERRR